MPKILFYALLLLHGSLAGAADIPEHIKACMAKNLPEDTSVQSIELRARDRAGYEKILQADVYWKRDQDKQSRVLMYFNEPVDVRGARFLIIDGMGFLSGLYQHATLAYIGGGFGAGIHNILEAATFGKPVIFHNSAKIRKYLDHFCIGNSAASA